MKKSFQKSLIAASVGAVMFAAAGTASANSLLFPYFTTATGAHSVLSIASNSTVAAGGETLHYVYNYGPTCIHFDGNGKVTNNDLLQHSVAAPAIGGFKAVPTDTSLPFHFPLPNTSGFLVVTNVTTPGATGITGDMAIVDPSTGLVAAYAGISNNSATEGDFSTAIVDKNFNLSAYSANFVDTSWYGVVTGNMNNAITGNRNWTAIASVSNQGVVYDNDEKPFSGLVSKTITCAGTIVPTDLLTTAQAAAVGSNGGLIHGLTTFPVPTIAADQGFGLVLSKLQFVKPATGAPFAGKMFLHRENGAAF